MNLKSIKTIVIAAAAIVALVGLAYRFRKQILSIRFFEKFQK